MKKTIYAITLILLGGALIIQSVWGADAKLPGIDGEPVRLVINSQPG